MAKSIKQQAAIAMSMKKAGKKPKSQGQKSIKKYKEGGPGDGKNKTQAATKDSTAYYSKAADNWLHLAKIDFPYGPISKGYINKAVENSENVLRQSRKGKPGYDKNGFPIKKKVGGSIKSKKK